MMESAKMEFEYWEDDKIIVNKVRGVVMYQLNQEQTAEYFNELKQKGWNKMLFDYREAQYISDTMKFYNRIKEAQGLSMSRDLAFALSFSELTEDIRFFETIFLNHGYRLKVFDDISEATAWLKEQEV